MSERVDGQGLHVCWNRDIHPDGQEEASRRRRKCREEIVCSLIYPGYTSLLSVESTDAAAQRTIVIRRKPKFKGWNLERRHDMLNILVARNSVGDVLIACLIQLGILIGSQRIQ